MLCRIVLIAYLIDKMTVGYMAAVAARGLIAGYQATLGGALLFAPVIAWRLFASGNSIILSVGIALVITQTVVSLGRVWWTKKVLKVPMSRWFWAVPVHCFMAATPPLLLAAFIAFRIPPSAGRILISFIGCGFSLCAAGWFFALDASERAYLLNVLKLCSRLLKRPNH